MKPDNMSSKEYRSFKKFTESYLGHKLTDEKWTKIFDEWMNIKPRRPLGDFLFYEGERFSQEKWQDINK